MNLTTTRTGHGRKSATPARNWRTAAACQTEDPEIFFPIGHSPQAIAQEAEAKKVCRRCPVIERCLQWALETGQEAGVWGGLAEDDRRALKRKPVRPVDIPEPAPRSKSHSHRYPGYATAVDGILGTRLDEVRALAGRGASVHEMASVLGSNMSTVRKVLERVGQPVDDTAEEVDHAAVNRFVQGFAADVKDADFLAAVQICVGRGMTLAEVDRLHMWEERTAENRVNRLRKRYKRAGREFPSLVQPSVRRFSEAEVVAIREKSQAGATDLELAMSYDVKRETIRSICRGLSYQQFGGPLRAARGGITPEASREWVAGHAGNSRAARTEMNQNEMGEAA